MSSYFRMNATVTSSTFTTLFVSFVVAMFAFQTWLSLRHRAHVGKHRAAVPAEFADLITLEAHQKAADYTREKIDVGLAASVVELALLLVLTLGGALWVFDHWAAEALTGMWRGVALVIGITFLSGLITLPFDLYRTFGIEAKFGFNKLTPGLYVLDTLKGWLLGAVIGIPLLLAVFWLMEKMGGLWWLYVWLTWLCFSLLMMAIYPNFIAPIFNKFTPLADETLKARIEALLTRCGFAAKGLFVMDGSKRSSHGNAYFTGFGKTKRIVFFDTLVERLTGPEIEAVLAHELGHFKRKHVAKMMIGQFALVFVILALMGWAINKPWFYEGLGAATTSPHVSLSLMLFFLVIPVFTFWLTPLGSLLSRKHEFEADAYAASQTQSRDLISALVKLYRDNASTLTPDPLHSAVYDSHPPANIRIAHLKTLARA